MNRWYGKIGFGVTVEVRKGIWKPQIVERNYYGDVLTFHKRMSSQSNSTNDNLNIDAQISVMADNYITSNCSTIRYVEFMGGMWKVSSIVPEPPRLLLTLGGVYNANDD